jgi:hypothetical protein
MVVIALPMFLVVAAFARLSRGSWRPWPSRRNGRRSIVSEAREAAETYVGFAFVGW